MLLSEEIKGQLSQYMELMEDDVLLKVSTGSDDVSQDMLQLVKELSAMSSRIQYEETSLKRTPSFSVNRANEDTGITFAGIPLGHEFTSLVLALLQVSGRAPKADENIIKQIQDLQGEYHFETYVSLSCTKCPDVVQAFNMMSVLNPNITHTMIDGAAFKEEAKDVMAVPSVYLNGEPFADGLMTAEEILSKLGSGPDVSELHEKDPFDVLVVGGGPAGASAAIYAARKGIRTGIAADKIGGQVLDTAGIENYISVPQTEGPKYAADLEKHINDYDIDVMTLQNAKRLEKKNNIEIELENGAVLESKTVILSTGAQWKKIGVPGETELRNKGVAYCPHCDGPMFEGKEIAVIGGGNSGVEAALDLAGVVKHVTLIEFGEKLIADSVLQERLRSLPNVTIVTKGQTTEITGKDSVDGLTYTDRETGNNVHLELSGVFILVGLSPNTGWLDGTVDRNKMGEIIVDRRGATNVPGVFAAGDCTDGPYKQIITAAGDGATASLSAFDYMVRNIPQKA